MNPCEAFEEAYLTWKYGGGDDYVEGAEEVKSAEGMLPLLLECLRYSRDTNQPLPFIAFIALEHSIEDLLSGRPDELLKKTDNISDRFSTTMSKYYAVSYVKICRKQKYDESPVKTVCEFFDIDDRTYRRWQKDFPHAPDNLETDSLLSRLSVDKDSLQRWLEVHARVYRIEKK